jgi:hypothetical protein
VVRDSPSRGGLAGRSPWRFVAGGRPLALPSCSSACSVPGVVGEQCAGGLARVAASVGLPAFLGDMDVSFGSVAAWLP